VFTAADIDCYILENKFEEKTTVAAGIQHHYSHNGLGEEAEPVQTVSPIYD
jgi:hypothetical protein